jgi:hypothetical protein
MWREVEQAGNWQGEVWNRRKEAIATIAQLAYYDSLTD